MITSIKVYIIVENFEKDYKFSDGYVNTVYSSKEDALKFCQELSALHENYSCHVEERLLVLDIKANVELSIK